MNKFYSLFFCLLFLILNQANPVWAQVSCQNGSAGGYPCNKVDLMSHLSPAELLAEEHGGILLNDIWGWTDPETGKEYALVGMANGTSFVDVSDPSNPLMLGILPEHHAAEWARRKGVMHDGGKSVWRDIKVYRNHAFIVSEDEGHGMQVFDLTQLRNVANPPATFAETANYQGIGKAHNIVINEETGFAYAVGANSPGYNCNGGGLHMINIQDPANPVFAGCYDGDGYTHDAQCVIYQGPDADYQGQEICFSSNEDAITIVDVTNKNSPGLISSRGYEGNQYAHQGWLTEDHRYFISNDELDEYYNGTNTTSYIWDIQDLDNPVFLGTYVSELTSIDHNLYIKDALVYEANYTSGLRILNIFKIAEANLREVAYFDTHPANDATVFEGAWSNYPFFESGIVVVSDITNGLFVLKPTLGLIAREPADVATCQSGEAFFELIPNKFNLSYQWQVDEGNGFVDLSESGVYSNVQTNRLQLSNIPPELHGNYYRLIVTDPEGGNEQISERSLLQVITPEAAFEYTDINRGELHFSNLSSNTTSFIWDFGDGSPQVTSQNPVHVYESEGPFTVRLEASGECGSDVFTLEVYPDVCREEEFVEASFAYEDVNKGEVHFNNLSVNGVSYRWDFGDGSENVEEENPVHRYEGEGPFTVRLEASNACGTDIFSQEIYPDVCTEADLPTARFEFSQEKGAEVQFTNLSEKASSYVWDFGDGSDPVEEENPSHYYQSSGPFEVRLSVGNGCGSDTYSSVISPVTGIEDKALAKVLEIFPNPSAGSLFIKWENSPEQVLSISFFNLKGQRLIHKEMNPLTDASLYSLELGMFAKGVYFLQVSSRGGSVNKRVMLR